MGQHEVVRQQRPQCFGVAALAQRVPGAVDASDRRGGEQLADIRIRPASRNGALLVRDAAQLFAGNPDHVEAAL